MEKIVKTLPTGVETSHPKRGGRIEVKVLDYDTYFDLPLLDTDVKEETTKRLKAMFQPQNRN
jgi:hypothetical protein